VNCYRVLTFVLLAAGSVTLGGCHDEITAPDSMPRSGAEASAGVASLAVAQNSWVAKADMWGIERYEFATAVVRSGSGQSVLYAIGGSTTSGSTLSRVMAYNPTTNVWTLKSPLPVPLKQTNGAEVIGGKIYLSGGLRSANDQSYSSALYVYDPATDTWSRKHDMPNTGLNGLSGVLNGKLYVVTSCFSDDNCECTSDGPCVGTGQWLFRYDPFVDSWTVLATPTAHIWYRDKLVGGTIGQKLYVGTPGSSSLSVYDPGTNTWSSRSTNAAVRFSASVTTLNAKLYMMGGYNVLGALVRTTNVYDPATNTWTTKAPLPNARANGSASRVSVNGASRIELVGGPRPGNNLQYTP
jgi:Kelch motif